MLKHGIKIGISVKKTTGDDASTSIKERYERIVMKECEKRANLLQFTTILIPNVFRCKIRDFDDISELNLS